MGNFEAIAWLPLCAGVTIAGLVLAFLAFRRRGAAAGLRTTAWALLPVAAYLTGALQSLWNIGTTVVGFVTGLVFNPAVWAGVAVAGLSVVLFVVSGVMRGRKLSSGRKKKDTGAAKDSGAAAEARQPVRGGGQAKAAPAAKPQQPAVAQKPASKGDDDFSDIEELLKRRGIS
ncbi:cellulose synthase [Nonomuraea sp. PA05]|uniref:cellulose synthase n=1 Tax=Nonomuraea sp. PA05 TaxID=2604466 RepID=UPI0011D6E3E0|nr:cellulose synthase [Nonomuraea sp. PA05]TYB70211.1 cellulose synthase [Nonomuraea sp. PA05]